MLRVGAALVLVVAALAMGCGGESGSGAAGSTAGSGTGASGSVASGDSEAGGEGEAGGSAGAQGSGAGSGSARRRGSAAGASRGVRLAKIGDFASPLYVTAPPGDNRRIFVVEQAGRIVVVRGGKRLARSFLDIRSKVTAGGEQGLLSMAFAPDYAQTGRFYVYYTERSGKEAIWEYRRATEDRADAGSARLVLRMADPEPNHNGGLMVFGADGLMYVGTGDGGGGDDQHGARGNAQSLGSLLGKILRIDPRPSADRPYTVPTSNPFVGRSGARSEVYAYGLRNPWRFSFDRATGDLSIADVGQDAVEEVDFVRQGRGRGTNFGWRPWEGRSRNFDEPARGAIFPVITHTHRAGFCSITGGYVVRDRSVPALYGRYVYGDFCEGRIRAATLRAGHRTTGRPLPLPRVGALSSFGEDASGRVYATSLNGPVYRLAAR
jgi:Glucose / Sorbosone dehydrogenase